MSDRNRMRKTATYLVLGIVSVISTGCANGPLLGSNKPIVAKPSETYIQIVKKGRTRCFTRVVEGMPYDEICQRGDYLRYSAELDSNSYTPVPEYVMALFDAMSQTVSTKGKPSPYISSYTQP
ncbi:hypothetical protein [Cohaesibacter celericrescens]|uniref:hypothetical protein n=1 Tax=Cohaesibacter celericrescens TaxID=2067669 RepID=UPI0011AFC203|nr:hypothetical protein [Cohaesibacter celericrescens]